MYALDVYALDRAGNRYSPPEALTIVTHRQTSYILVTHALLLANERLTSSHKSQSLHWPPESREHKHLQFNQRGKPHESEVISDDKLHVGLNVQSSSDVPSKYGIK